MSVEERAAASVAICDAANALLAERVEAGAVVALYAAKGSEVDTSRIDAAARRAGLVVVYPRVIEEARTLAFHAVTVDQLAPTRFGLREPSADAEVVAVAEVAAARAAVVRAGDAVVRPVAAVAAAADAAAADALTGTVPVC